MPRSGLLGKTSACRLGGVLLAFGMASGWGCAISPWKAVPAASSAATVGTANSAATATSSPSATNGQTQVGPPAAAACSAPAQQADAAATSAQTPRPDLQAIDQLVAKIAERDGLDAAARARLTQDLRQTDPTLWPALMQAFEAALAYQRQIQLKENRNASAGNQAMGTAVNQSPGASEPPAGQARSSASGPNRVAAGEFRTSASEGGPPPSPPVLAVQTPALLPPRTKSESASDPMGSLAAVERPLPRIEERESSRGQRDLEKEKRDLPRVSAESGNATDVVPASYPSPIRGASELWLERLDGAVKALEAEARQSPQTATELARQARLRLLYLASGRREDAMRPIPAASPAMQDSWSQMLYGLATWMDVERVPDASRRAAEARQQLLAAAQRLGELAPLLVRNASFAKEVKSYGDISPFEKTEFSPGQEVLLYAELENFKCEETPKGFHTQFRGSYEIFDARGQRVTAQELGKTEEYCRNYRRDFFLVYNFRLPKRIYNGRHILQLTVEDLHGQKIGQTSLEFTIKGSGE